MEAIFVQNSKHLDDFQKELTEKIPFFYQDNITHRFSMDSSIVGFSYDGGIGISNALVLLPQNCFSRIYVSSDFRLFNNNWGKVFLQHLNKALLSDGELILSFHKDSIAARKGFWSHSGLRKFFSNKERQSVDNFLNFRKSTEAESIKSTLTWFFSSAAEISMEEMYCRKPSGSKGPQMLPQYLEAFMLSGKNNVSADYYREPAVSIDDGWLRQSYYFGGIQYKSAVLSKIINELIPHVKKASHLDHGGGYGLLGTELLLDESSSVDQSVCCECDAQNVLVSRKMYHYFLPELEKRFFMAACPIQDFIYEQNYDVITYIGSLLYVPRDRTTEVLQNAWRSLNPGGLLVIHENIKNPSFKRDFDYMFTVEELEQYLEPFGKIKHYLSTAAVEVANDNVANKTVFRVLQKNI